MDMAISVGIPKDLTHLFNVVILIQYDYCPAFIGGANDQILQFTKLFQSFFNIGICIFFLLSNLSRSCSIRL